MTALAAYKDLCVDAVDPARLAAFWAATLGLEPEPLDDGDLVLRGPTPQHTVWVNRVAEPVTVKQRVHLDVHAAVVDDVLALGAEPEDLTSFRWKVVRDPEGGELCVFERDTVPAYRLYEVVVDAGEHERIAAWWADVLGGKYDTDVERGFSWVEQIPALPSRAGVRPGPRAEDGQEPDPLGRGHRRRGPWSLRAPTVLRERDDEIGWTVLADPEGNEFCAFTD